MQFDRPDVVVAEITAMIEAIRAGEPLAPVVESPDDDDAHDKP